MLLVGLRYRSISWVPQNQVGVALLFCVLDERVWPWHWQMLGALPGARRKPSTSSFGSHKNRPQVDLQSNEKLDPSTPQSIKGVTKQHTRTTSSYFSVSKTKPRTECVRQRNAFFICHRPAFGLESAPLTIDVIIFDSSVVNAICDPKLPIGRASSFN